MFKSVIFLFCGLVAVGFCGAFDKSFRDGKSILLGVSFVSECKSYFSCLDCNTARICKPDGLGKFEQVTTIPCPLTKPYCNEVSGTCSEIPDEKCGAADATFVCMADGYFPDANCTNYHICSGFKAFKYHCSQKGENYDAVQKKCIAKAPCGTFDCTTAGRKVPHSYYAQYYGYCSGAGLLPTVIDRCNGPYVMNVTSQLCESICTTEGVLEDVDDCTKYFRCHNEMLPTGTKGKWTAVMMKDHMTCPQNTAFDPRQFICVDIKNTKCVPKSRSKEPYVMNVTNQHSESICTTEGVLEDVDDCTKYFRCHYEILPAGDGEWTGVMMKDQMECPKNAAFDPKQSICVDIKNTKCVPKSRKS